MKKEERKNLAKQVAALKVEICKQNGGCTDYEKWLHFMQKQTGAELVRIKENIEKHLNRKVALC